MRRLLQDIVDRRRIIPEDQREACELLHDLRGRAREVDAFCKSFHAMIENLERVCYSPDRQQFAARNRRTGETVRPTRQWPPPSIEEWNKWYRNRGLRD